MNEFTTIDNIKKAFSLILGDDYSLDFHEDQKTFYLFNNITMSKVLNFEYDNETRKFSYYKLTDSDFRETADSIFTQFDSFKTCQMISDSFFNNEISKIIFKAPILFEADTFTRSKILGKRITLSPIFCYMNAWNMLFVELGYVVTEDFKIKPIIDLCINLRGFGKTRFFVDEYSGQFVNLLETNHYRLNTEHSALSTTTTISVVSSTDIVRNVAINKKPTLVGLNDYINDFINILTPELYTFYVNQFNVVGISSEANGSINDFKVLEMLKV